MAGPARPGRPGRRSPAHPRRPRPGHHDQRALAVAAAGAITAWQVADEKLLPALTGLAQAVLALIVGLGVDLSPEQQAAVLAPIAILAGFVVRDRVTAPSPAAAKPPHVVA